MFALGAAAVPPASHVGLSLGLAPGLSALILLSSVRDLTHRSCQAFAPWLRSGRRSAYSLYLLHNPIQALVAQFEWRRFSNARSRRRSFAGAPAFAACCAVFPLCRSLVASSDAACSALPSAQLKVFNASLPHLLGRLRFRRPGQRPPHCQLCPVGSGRIPHTADWLA